MHFLNTHKAKKHYVAIKVDMDKAFDILEWNYLVELLSYLGFDHKRTHWILQFISTISFSLLVNGSPCGFFRLKRGIRQGILSRLFFSYWPWKLYLDCINK